MNAKDLIKAGKLSEARKQLIEAVKSSPADLGKRTLLFQVLCFCGEWDKAERQLEVIALQDASTEIGVQVYKNLLHAEKQRIDVLHLKYRPAFLPKSPTYFEKYDAALQALGENRIDAAKALFHEVNEQIPVISGTLNNKPFSGFRDSDTFVSLFLEVFVHEQYIRIPFEAIREFSVLPPETLFDLLWIETHIMTWEGLSLHGYLPVLYTDSCKHEDERVKLGRMTDWISLGGSFFKAMGQHVFEIGDDEIPLLEIREVFFNAPESGRKR